MEKFLQFQVLFREMLELIHFQGDIQSFISEAAGRAITHTYLDLLESLPDEKLVALNKVVTQDDPQTIINALPQYLSEDEYNAHLFKNLSETLQSFVEDISTGVPDEQKKVFEELYQDFLHTS